MNKKTIYIICNSERALDIITGHNTHFDGMHEDDLFTCNNAYTFFRTSGRHLNFWTDTIDIIRKVIMPETLSKGYQDRVEHIYSLFGLTLGNGNLLYRGLRTSPVPGGSSSALGALAYLVACEDYDQIDLVGYTLDESQNKMWLYILDHFNKEIKYENYFVFTRKP